MSFFSNLSTLFNKDVSSRSPHRKPTGHTPHKKAPQLVKPVQPPAATPSPTPPAPAVIKTAVMDEVAFREAQAKAREIIVEARTEALSVRSQAEEQARLLTKRRATTLTGKKAR
ncbi:MAG TPA: hypothetical protein PKX78_04390 [Candidatus Woesebacteria bacterium]|nr:hypothetical protein [Candidatus Woesebacteria bacterium]